MTKKRTPPPARTGRGVRSTCDPAKDHDANPSAPRVHEQQSRGRCRVEGRPGKAAAFTSESVFALLRERILKANEALPSIKDSGIAQLALALNIIRHQVEETREAWREEPNRLKRIDDAIGVLTDELPLQLQYFTEIAGGAQADAPGPLLSAAKELVTSARKVRKHGVPQGINMLFLPSLPIKSWMDIATDLQKVFSNALPGQPKAAIYRFIAEVVPAITGETPTVEAVKTAFKKKRVVNRGTRGFG